MRSFEQQQKNSNASSLTIHPQLEVGGKDDPQEKEANAMADKVMRMSDGDTVRPKMGDDEEKKVMKMGDEEEGKVMKMGDDEEKKVMKMGDDEEKKVHKKSDEEEGKVMKMDAGGGGGMAAPADVSSGIQNTKGGGQNLPQNVQQDLGSKMGADFSDVKVHTDDHASEMSESINAKAFTHGKDIYFKQGNYSPESGDGKKLLAHELTHTMQSGGTVRRQQLGDTETYTVKTKDTLYSIANAHGTTVEELKKVNNLTSDNIKIGQKLKVPKARQPEKVSKQNTYDPREAKMYVDDKIAKITVHTGGKLTSLITPTGSNQDEYVVWASRNDMTVVDVTTVTGKKQTRVMVPSFMSMDFQDGPSKLRIIAKPTVDSILKHKSPYPPGDYSVGKSRAKDYINNVTDFYQDLYDDYYNIVDTIETRMGFESTDIGEIVVEELMSATVGVIGKLNEAAGFVLEILTSALNAYKKYQDASSKNKMLSTLAGLKDNLRFQKDKAMIRLQEIEDAIETNFELMQKLSADKFTARNQKMTQLLSNAYEIQVWKRVLPFKFKDYQSFYFYKSLNATKEQEKKNPAFYYEATPGTEKHTLFWITLWEDKGYNVSEHLLTSSDDDTTSYVANRLVNQLGVSKYDLFNNWNLPVEYAYQPQPGDVAL